MGEVVSFQTAVERIRERFMQKMMGVVRQLPPDVLEKIAEDARAIAKHRAARDGSPATHPQVTAAPMDSGD